MRACIMEANTQFNKPSNSNNGCYTFTVDKPSSGRPTLVQSCQHFAAGQKLYKSRETPAKTCGHTQITQRTKPRRKCRRLSKSTSVALRLSTYKSTYIASRSEPGCGDRTVHAVRVSVTKQVVNVSEQNAIMLMLWKC